jgi:hypothetical protein
MLLEDEVKKIWPLNPSSQRAKAFAKKEDHRSQKEKRVREGTWLQHLKEDEI